MKSKEGGSALLFVFPSALYLNRNKTLTYSSLSVIERCEREYFRSFYRANFPLISTFPSDNVFPTCRGEMNVDIANGMLSFLQAVDYAAVCFYCYFQTVLSGSSASFLLKRICKAVQITYGCHLKDLSLR